uniref:KIB1-4 beta-propeller domain-containing protein n=1 Tax=Aegilops tauschii TaxID=37682 RepID=R7WDT0_AEGTA
MAVLKETAGDRMLPSFMVQVLGAGAQEWKETDDISDAAMFVGTKGLLCVSTSEHPELRAGCIYYNYTADSHVVVLSLKGGTVEQVEGLGTHRSWPPLEWFTPWPCIPR